MVVPEEPAVVVRRLEELYLYLGQRPVDLLLLENPVGLRGEWISDELYWVTFQAPSRLVNYCSGFT